MKQKALLPKTKNSPAATIQNKSKVALTPPAQFRKVNEKGTAEQQLHTDGTVQRVFSVAEDDDNTITFNDEDELKKYSLFKQEDPMVQQTLLEMFKSKTDYKSAPWPDLLLQANRLLNVKKKYDKDDELNKFFEGEKNKKRNKVDLKSYNSNKKQKIDKITKNKKMAKNIKKEMKKFLQVGDNHCWAAVSYAVHCHYGGNYKDIAQFIDNHASKDSVDKLNEDQTNDINEASGSFSNRDYFTASDKDMPVALSEFLKETKKKQPVIANVGEHYILIRSTFKKNNKYKMTVMDPAVGYDETMDVTTEYGLNEKKKSVLKVKKVGNYEINTVYYTANKN